MNKNYTLFTLIIFSDSYECMYVCLNNIVLNVHKKINSNFVEI